jgi:hypothetical protein
LETKRVRLIGKMTNKSNRGGLRNPPGGRPKKPPEEVLVSTSIRLPQDLVDWLRANTENRNGFIIEAIREKIKNDTSK